MEISARNSLKGTIKKIEVGAVNTEVTLEITPGVEVIGSPVLLVKKSRRLIAF